MVWKRTLVFLRPDGRGFFALDWYDGRGEWQATNHGLDRVEAAEKLREARSQVAPGTAQEGQERSRRPDQGFCH